MRTASFLAFIMITAVLLSSPVVASPPTQGETETISDSTMWNDGTFDGEILIQNGGELHWTGTVDVKEDSNIVVEDGGVLHLDSVHFQGENTASTLLIYDGTEIDVSEQIQDSAATMTIYFNTNVPESAYLNLTIDGVTSFEITGAVSYTHLRAHET